MNSGSDRTQPSSAAIRMYRSRRYTVVTMANGAVPKTVETELWWLDGEK